MFERKQDIIDVLNVFKLRLTQRDKEKARSSSRRGKIMM